MGKKMGRPSKYEAKFCDELIEHMASGHSFASFGAIADVGENTLYLWAKTHPEFAEAKSRAELKSLFWWEKTGISGLYTDKDNRFTSAVWIFSMKARFVKYGYRDNHELDDPDVESARLTPSERLLKIVKSGIEK